MQEASNGKDTMTGHWEIMGLELMNRFVCSLMAFQMNYLTALEQEDGRGFLGNKVASGTEILR